MPETIGRKADGTSGGTVSLSEKLFNAKINPGLMHQAVVNEATNSRQDTRNTKTRGEVAGGGQEAVPSKREQAGRGREPFRPRIIGTAASSSGRIRVICRPNCPKRPAGRRWLRHCPQRLPTA